ncbi:hypothetical protein F5Y19DRAFT_465166 [Xylariaceae sp. FL1651]|nr:hypothetical protein F5Y19DRAFT_465166 [Xylariaceae sp. FL1651]
MSDDEEEDDDICVWKDGPELPDIYDSEDEPLAGHFRKVQVEAVVQADSSDDRHEKAEDTHKIERTRSRENGTKATRPAKLVEDTQAPKLTTGTTNSSNDPWPRTQTGKLTEEAFRERELQYALSTTRRNLTRVSQFLLKLEARAGKATKEGIRQTLDATVRDNNYDFNTCGSEGGPPDADHKGEIEEIKHLSEGLYNRLYLIDRHWRRLARETSDAEGHSPEISLLSEPDIKEWLKIELRTNHLATEETCFFTVQDLASHRSFRDWAVYLQKLCGFGEHPSDEAKLVELAWRFLDRNLRGPRPVNPTPLEQFIKELEDKKRRGVWAEALKNPKKQQEDDAEAWRAMRRYWSSRTAPA